MSVINIYVRVEGTERGKVRMINMVPSLSDSLSELVADALVAAAIWLWTARRAVRPPVFKIVEVIWSAEGLLIFLPSLGPLPELILINGNKYSCALLVIVLCFFLARRELELTAPFCANYGKHFALPAG